MSQAAEKVPGPVCMHALGRASDFRVFGQGYSGVEI